MDLENFGGASGGASIGFWKHWGGHGPPGPPGLAGPAIYLRSFFCDIEIDLPRHFYY